MENQPHRPLPALDRTQPRIACAADAGVVAHDVDSTEAVERGLDEFVDRLPAADVGADCQRVDALLVCS